MNIVCVLKAGGVYDKEWVRKLKDAVSRHYTKNYRFCCLTDLGDIEGVETIPLQHNWEGYWAKVELFRPGLFEGLTLYTDLDVLITRNIDRLGEDQGGFVMLEDYYPEIYNSTLLQFDASNKLYSGIYTYFKYSEYDIKRRYALGVNGANFGDQLYFSNWLRDNQAPVLKWQEVLPRDMFMPFSYTSQLNPEIEQWHSEHPAAYVYCLGNPKFNALPKLEIVKQHWV